MVGVLDGHVRDNAARGLIQQEPLDHLGHAQQRGECHEHLAPGGLGTGEALRVNCQWWLFVEPHQIDRVGLPLGAALVVAAELHHAVLTTDVAHHC